MNNKFVPLDPGARSDGSDIKLEEEYELHFQPQLRLPLSRSGTVVSPPESLPDSKT
ncbi:hypothetical protein A2U01_0033369, partial [Trifolium medium]|nr:hypothetical protein [Trifolium medium]